MTTIQQELTTIHPVSPQQALQQDENVNIATVSDGGRELSKTILYIGNIPQSIGEEGLSELFSPFKSIKVLHDKNNHGFNYSFVEYSTNEEASETLNRLNGEMINDCPLKITWAFQTQQLKESSETFNLFIGDLSLEVNDDTLTKAFSQYTSLVQANVMWDMKTGRSRGYGFVNFREKEDASQALQSMNGQMLGDRPIRLNWATHKQNNNNGHNSTSQHHHHHHHNNNINTANNYNNNNNNTSNRFNYQPYTNNSNIIHRGILAPIMLQQQPPQQLQQQSQQMPQQMPIMGPQSYDIILRQAPNWLTVVYLGNLAHFTTQNDLIPLLQNFGYIVNFKLMADKGCAFVTYDSHERAAMAIIQLSGFTINGRSLKCGWGKQGKPPLGRAGTTLSE